MCSFAKSAAAVVWPDALSTQHFTSTCTLHLTSAIQSWTDVLAQSQPLGQHAIYWSDASRIVDRRHTCMPFHVHAVDLRVLRSLNDFIAIQTCLSAAWASSFVIILMW